MRCSHVRTPIDMHRTVVGRKINFVLLTCRVIAILHCFWMWSNTKIYSCGGWWCRCFALFCLLLYSNLLRCKSASHPSKPETHATGETGCHRRLRKRLWM